MIPYLGDFVEDDTVYVMFNTFSSDDPSASCTITNLINTDIHIHKDDGLAQRNNAAGITVSVNFDGITGSHMVKIDTNDNTVAGFWVAGHDYFVRIEGTTIDGATINAVVAHFSIQNRFMRGTDSAALAATALTDVTWTDAKAAFLNHSISTIDGNVDTILSRVTAAVALASVCTDTRLGELDGANLPTDVANVKAETATIVADTGELQTDWHDGGRLDLILDIIAADTTTDILAKVLKYIQLLSRSDAAIATDNATELTAINADGGSGAGDFSNQTDAVEAIRDRGDSAWPTATGFATSGALSTHDGKLDTVDTVVDGIQTDLDNATDGLGALKALIDIIDGIVDNILSDTNELQTDWVNGGRLDLILDIIAADTTTDIPATISTMQGNVTNILADTNELQGDWINGGRLDLLLDACALEATVAALNNISASDVNAQVVDVLKTDTTSEMVQGAPPASPTIEEMIAYLYFKMRNKQETTATEDAIYDDTGAVKLFKSSISDDNITFTKGKYASGA